MSEKGEVQVLLNTTPGCGLIDYDGSTIVVVTPGSSRPAGPASPGKRTEMVKNESLNAGTKERNSPLISAGKRRIASETLLGDQNDVVIVHKEQEYRLRCTRHGKLILTK